MGMSIGVVHRGQTLFRYNYGCKDLVERDPPDSSTIYGIGSVTKSFTALAIAHLVAEGRFSYETRVKDILPEFKSACDQVTEQANVADVVHHRLCLARSNA